MNLDSKLLVFSRSTYDLLTWLSDIGGCKAALFSIAEIILMPFTIFNLKSFLLTYLFRMSSHSSNDQSKENNQSEQKLSHFLNKSNTLAATLFQEKKDDISLESDKIISKEKMF